MISLALWLLAFSPQHPKKMPAYSTLALAYDGPVATITLNRPEKRNAISYELISELLGALGEVEISFGANPYPYRSRQGVLLGHGSRQPAFDHGAYAGRESVRLGHHGPAVPHLYEFPKVTIAAVNGPAIAGGCGVATLCDFTLASTEAKFGYTEVRIGFVPAIVSTFLLRQIGEKQARDLLLTGRIISAEEAFRLGLANEIVAPGKLLTRARELAASLLAEQSSIAAGDQAAAQAHFLGALSTADCRRGGRERTHP